MELFTRGLDVGNVQSCAKVSWCWSRWQAEQLVAVRKRAREVETDRHHHHSFSLLLLCFSCYSPLIFSLSVSYVADPALPLVQPTTPAPTTTAPPTTAPPTPAPTGLGFIGCFMDGNDTNRDFNGPQQGTADMTVRFIHSLLSVLSLSFCLILYLSSLSALSGSLLPFLSVCLSVSLSLWCLSSFVISLSVLLCLSVSISDSLCALSDVTLFYVFSLPSARVSVRHKASSMLLFSSQYRYEKTELRRTISSISLTSHLSLLSWYQCFCANSYGRFGPAPLSDCNMPCAGQSSLTCGAAWRNSVYSSGYFPTPAPSSGFIGCYIDQDSRDLGSSLTSTQTMQVGDNDIIALKIQ